MGGTGRGEGAVLERGATGVVFPGPTIGGFDGGRMVPSPRIKHLRMAQYEEIPHLSRAFILRDSGK